MKDLPEGWSVIATRFGAGGWQELPRPVLTVDEARSLRILGRVELRETAVGRRVILAVRPISPRT
jgi:hypothetical protein